MKVGITSYYLDCYGLDAGMARMRAHGYESLDYSGMLSTDSPLFSGTEAEFSAKLTAVRRAAEQNGISIFQAHGPWRFPMRDATPEDRAERFEKMTKSIRGCAILGCPHMVIHRVMPFGNCDLGNAKTMEISRDFAQKLADVGREYGVVVCLENMPFQNQELATPKALAAFVREIDHPNLKMCLDTGHANVFGISCADAVRQIGQDLLRVLHIHDNDGTMDQHRMPGDGSIAWRPFVQALSAIGYTGPFSLECHLPTQADEATELALAKATRRIVSDI